MAGGTGIRIKRKWRSRGGMYSWCLSSRRAWNRHGMAFRCKL